MPSTSPFLRFAGARARDGGKPSRIKHEMRNDECEIMNAEQVTKDERGNLIRRTLATLFCAVSWLVPTHSIAQAFPSKPVRIIVPFSAGSGSDVFARTLGPKFTEAWGQQIVVENREGAGGIIGAQVVAKPAPDGYTLLLAATPWAVSPSLYAKPPYDPLRDFVPIGRIGFVPSVLVVHPTLPVNDVSQLIQLAKARPGQL